MKKAVSLILLCVLLFCGCGGKTPQKQNEKSPVKADKAGKINGIWISYIELDGMFSSDDFEGEFKKALKNCKAAGITDLFVHAVPFCDAYYKSQYYPLRKQAQNCGFDPLEKMVTLSHKEGLKIHAWINPYRVSTSSENPEELPEKSPARKWFSSADGKINVCIYKGIYLNPAEFEARKLIINAVREITEKYAVDGIHIDDYFYPTCDPCFDAESYEAYKASTKTSLALDDWRRANVNALVSALYTAIKYNNKDTVFSVSPAASISRNYAEYYADIKAWCQGGCIDYVIPQLYFGFEYPDEKYCFDNLLSQWKELIKDTDVKLLIGLASYKIETEQKPDCDEWRSGSVIVNETEICTKDSSVSGEVYFSYNTFFGESEEHQKALFGIEQLIDSDAQK